MKKIIVIRAGIIGLSISYYLKKHDFHIAVIEKSRAGSEASYAAAGMLAAQSEFDFYEDFMDFCVKSRDMYPDYCNEIEKASGIDVEFQKCGMLRPALNEDPERRLRANHQWHKNIAFEIEFLSGEEMREIEPSLSKNIISGLYSKNDGQVNNRKLMQALIIANKNMNNKIIENTEVRDYLVNNQNKKIIGVKTSNNETFNADIVINTAGSWSFSISKDLIPNFNVKPILGKMVSLLSDNPFGPILA